MVATFEFDHSVTTCVAAGGSDGIHRRFRAGVGESNLIDHEATADSLSSITGLRGRGDEEGAHFEHLLHLFYDDWIEVTGEHRTEAHGEIEDLAAVDILHPCTFGGLDRDRKWIPMLE